MKKALSIVLIFALMSSTIGKLCILIDFKINQNYIADVLCLNKTRPEIQCHGQCFLSKELSEQEEQENKTVPASHKEKSEVLYFSTQVEFTSPTPKEIVLQNIASPYEAVFHSSGFLNEIFRPPQSS